VELFGYQFAKRSAVAIFHPTIRTNEAQVAFVGKQKEGTLNERDVQVSSVVQG